MKECKLLDGCLFLHSLGEKEAELAGLFTTLYCRGDFNRCARYEAAGALGRERVPDTLYPNEKELVSMFSCFGDASQ